MTHTDIIALWPAPRDLADDTGADILLVYKWRERNRIPYKWVLAVSSAAKARGIKINSIDILSAESGGKEGK